MDRILDTVDDIRSALRSRSDDTLQHSSEELAKHLDDLKQRALGCTKDTESVAKKFAEWRLEVTKISEAFAEVQGNHLLFHVE